MSEWEFGPLPWTGVALVLLPYLALIRDSRSVPKDASSSSLADYRLHKLATAWNVFMATFSVWGTWSMWDLLLQPSQVMEPTAGWKTPAAFYVFSKFWELVDTVLLYARGRPIGRLHWTHHILTLLYSVWAYNQCALHGYDHCLRASEYFAVLNYSVHAVMYSYYAALYWWKGLRDYGSYVTLLQISQFVWAMLYTWWYRDYFAWGTFVTAWLMYGYYLCEFLKILRTRQ